MSASELKRKHSSIPSRIPVWRHGVALARLVRRWFSRREIIVRLLGLPPIHPPSDDPGLIILQIDGLSRSRLEEAIQHGRLPFIASLVRADRHRVKTLYSGQPATTPAVLGELFYGIQQVVPAFSFRDHRTGQVIEMLESEVAGTIQRELEAQTTGLLTGGAAYCDIYSGGAHDSQFCPGHTRWARLDQASVWKKGLLILLHLPALVRMFAAVGRETWLSTWRLVRKRSRIRNWLAEIKFIPRHLVASVILREVTAAAIESDAVRGVERVHGNFLGYDDVAHHCGPEAAIPRRMLRDIDRSIERIWHAAHGSPRRNYQVWIIADHGQEATVPYSELVGRTVDDAVREVARDHLPASNAAGTDDADPDRAGDERARSPLTVAIGPLGYVYWPGPLDDATRLSVAARLVAEAKIPLVMTCVDEAPRAWTSRGDFQLPQQASEVFGAEHPHLEAVSKDFAALCRHADAGEFVLCGWQPGQPAVSFVEELGAHGGPGPQETSGFVILPPDAPPLPQASLRPRLLRDMALRWLQPRTHLPVPAIEDRQHERPFLRVATYNVHGCIGLDGRLSPARIARVLQGLDADIVALQELDVGRSRSHAVDQAQVIADILEMQLHFGAAIDVTGERYGNAILSRWPMTLQRAAILSESRGRSEPRGAVWATVNVGDETIDVISTHLGLTRSDRTRQLGRLLSDDWPCTAGRNARTILCGDLNSSPGSSVCRQLGQHFQDVQLADGQRGRATWSSGLPLRRIDHIFVGGAFRVRRTEVPRTRWTRVASDHLPLVADLEFTPISNPVGQAPPAAPKIRAPL